MSPAQQSLETRTVHPVPDRHGSNLYTTDTQFAPLLQLYLPQDVNAHLQPYLTRMGELAGGRLDELALIADKNPP
ncbi:MAG: DNA alkylation response protein, partial [Comamonas sp.]